jgi:hypothetical protein
VTPALSTTVSTAWKPESASSFTVGAFIEGSTASTRARSASATFSLISTLDRAVAAPTSRVSRSSMAWRRSGSAADTGLATTSVKEVSRVAITTMPWLRRVEPVSVRSTTASTISGTLASVAP